MIIFGNNNKNNTPAPAPAPVKKAMTEKEYLAKMLGTSNLEQKEAKLQAGIYELIFESVEAKATVKGGKPKAWLVVKGHLADGSVVAVRNLWIHTEGGAKMSFGMLAEQGMPLTYKPDSTYQDYINELNTYEGVLKLGVYEDIYYTTSANGKTNMNTAMVYTLDLTKIGKLEQAIKEAVNDQEVSEEDADF